MRHSYLLVSFALIAGLTACEASLPPAAVAQNVTPPTPAAPQLGALSAAARSTDKGPNKHNYTELYERLFFQWKNDPIKIFEIGVAAGGSLEMWQSYFPQARVFAIDIFDKSQFNNARVTTLIADQANRDQLQKAIDASMPLAVAGVLLTRRGLAPLAMVPSAATWTTGGSRVTTGGES